MTLPDFDPGFSTDAMNAIWSVTARVRRFCDVEAALALASARASVVPASAAESIRTACASLDTDGGQVLAEGWTEGSPLLPLLHRLRTRLTPDVARYLHFGATSQDIVDTATALQMRDGFAELRATAMKLATALAGHAAAQAGSWIMARTLLQPAQPLRLSLRIANWLNPVLADVEALDTIVAALPVQLGGAVGDLAAFGRAADTVVAELARELGLAVPELPWHTDRRPVRDAVNAVLALAQTTGKLGADLVLLSQPELGEVIVPHGRSSAMSHKKNAIGPVRAVAASRACQAVATIVAGAAAHELERAAGAWHAEWFAVPLVFQTAAAALAAIQGAVAGMTFDEARASEHLYGKTMPERESGERFVKRVLARFDRLAEGRRS